MRQYNTLAPGHCVIYSTLQHISVFILERRTIETRKRTKVYKNYESKDTCTQFINLEGHCYNIASEHSEDTMATVQGFLTMSN